MKNAPKVLLVEDDEDDLFLTSRILRRAGFSEVYRVADGRAALEYLSGLGPFGNREVHPLPDVVLVDLKIPEINGHKVIEWIGSRPELNGLRYYVLSSSGEERDRERAAASGIAGYFVKPLTSDDIAAILAAQPAGCERASPAERCG